MCEKTNKSKKAPVRHLADRNLTCCAQSRAASTARIQSARDWMCELAPSVPLRAFGSACVRAQIDIHSDAGLSARATPRSTRTASGSLQKSRFDLRASRTDILISAACPLAERALREIAPHREARLLTCCASANAAQRDQSQVWRTDAIRGFRVLYVEEARGGGGGEQSSLADNSKPARTPG